MTSLLFAIYYQRAVLFKKEVFWRQVAHLVERRTLGVEVWGSKPGLGTWCWGWIPPCQPCPKGAVLVATTPLIEWWHQIFLNGMKAVSKKKKRCMSHRKSDKTVTNLDLTTKDNVTRDSFKKHIKRFAFIVASSVTNRMTI